MASMPSTRPPMYVRGGKLVDGALEGGQACLCSVHGGLVVRVLLVRRTLGRQLVVQVELRAMHRLGGLLGLTRQLVELCQRVIGRIGHGICGKNTREDDRSPLTHLEQNV